jgi:guanylate kinase
MTAISEARASAEHPTTIETGRRGLMLILSSPSGAGKTTLTRMLLQDKAIDLTLSVSATTRARRSSEVDGIHYHFIQPDHFERMRVANEFLEYAKVHDNFYGTPRGLVERVLAQGRDMLFDIDYLHPAAVDEGTAGPARASRGGSRRRH